MVAQSREVRITCPSCDASYDVPELAAGRAVQCARCGERWAPVPAAVLPAPTAAAVPPLPDPPPPILPPLQAPPRPVSMLHDPVDAPDEFADEPPLRPLVPVLAWVASLALLGGLAAAAVAYRGPIMHAWPPSQRAYAVIGLT